MTSQMGSAQVGRRPVQHKSYTSYTASKCQIHVNCKLCLLRGSSFSGHPLSCFSSHFPFVPESSRPSPQSPWLKLGRVRPGNFLPALSPRRVKELRFGRLGTPPGKGDGPRAVLDPRGLPGQMFMRNLTMAKGRDPPPSPGCS